VIPILTPTEMAAVDAAAAVPVSELIDRAGRAVARAALDLLGGTYGRVVNVIVGNGNNGADGRVAADVLCRRGVHVRLIEASTRPPILRRCDLVIDAAYGTGFHGEWIAPEIGDAAVLAVDIPSGVDALTGHAGPGVLPADRTVTFQALKPGHVFGAGARLAGEVTVVDIGLDVSGATQHLVEAADVAVWWPRRPVDSHKWNGAVRVVAGSQGMRGAAQLCAEAAARAGAGLVKLSVPGLDAVTRSEIVQHRLDDCGWTADLMSDIARFGSLVIGPGLGRAEHTIESIRSTILEATVPLVIDGDALFAAAWDSDGAAPLFVDRRLPTVLTPHDGEFSILTGSLPGVDRVAAARQLAAELACTVLLKGPTTVVADADGAAYVVAGGDERLATAGTGDVLAGMIGTALAMGAPGALAAAAAAWLHAAAGRLGPAEGVLAGDLIDALPRALAGVR
jgi:NAD(P)H-hydrate epimerase